MESEIMLPDAPDPLFIRKMQIEDLQSIIKIEKQCYPFPWTEGIFYDCIRVGYRCFVYTPCDDVRAYAIMSIAANEAHILNLCVTQKFHRQGIGRCMLLFLLDKATQEGASDVYLEVRASNQGAIPLYLSCGFQQIAVRKDYYPDHNNTREDAWIFRYCSRV